MFFKMLERIFLFVFVLNISGFVVADYLKDENMERDARDPPGIMWFGPRIGKRSGDSSDVEKAQAVEKMLEAAEMLKAYYDQLNVVVHVEDNPGKQVMKKLIFTPKLGRSLDDERALEVDFTPRLGRRMLGQDGPNVDPVIESRSQNQYFSPRLGRYFSPSPRLGRNLLYDIPENVRIARSAERTKRNKTNT